MRKNLEILPNQNKIEIEKYQALQMIAVKDRGMSLDFIDYLIYMFENNSEMFPEELEKIINDENLREKLLSLSKSIDPLFVVTLKPNEDFWMTHYGHHSKFYYYEVFMKKLRNARFAFILFGSQTLLQEELDYFIHKLKGSATILDTESELPIVLKEGTGIRGIAEAEGVMINESYAKELAKIANISEEVLKETIETINLADTKRFLYTKLPKDFQDLAFLFLKENEQHRLMSNFIHAPDRGAVSIKSLDTIKLSDVLDFHPLQKGINLEDFKKLCSKE